MRLAQRFRPDVLVLDIRLPDINGYELMQRFREMDTIRRARFIAVSGYGDGAPADLSTSFDHFLEKPLNLEQLNALLHPSPDTVRKSSDRPGEMP